MGGVVTKWHGEVPSKILPPNKEYPSGHQLSPSFLLLRATDFKVPGDDGSMLSKLPGSHLPRLLFPSWPPTNLWFSGRKTATDKELYHFP